jgi:hypothetical protein
VTRYAEGTSVPVDRSRAEIERTLERYGGDAWQFTKTPEAATLAWRMRGRALKVRIPLPPLEDFRYYTSRGYDRERTDQAMADLRRQEERRRYRVLLLHLKSTLEAIDAGVIDFDTAFLGNFVLRDGRTYAEAAIPELDDHYATGRMPLALPGE